MSYVHAVYACVLTSQRLACTPGYEPYVLASAATPRPLSGGVVLLPRLKWDHWLEVDSYSRRWQTIASPSDVTPRRLGHLAI